jgi:hypothetical protein
MCKLVREEFQRIYQQLNMDFYISWAPS